MTDNESGGSSDATMNVLSSEECYRFLGMHEIGRIGMNAEHYPLVLPVNYALDGTTIVFRTHAGTILRAVDQANVIFEVDDIDRRSRTGWSVLVRGRAEEVGGPQRAEFVAGTQGAGVQPWAPGEKGHWVRVTPQEISGRRITPGELPDLDPRAYL